MTSKEAILKTCRDMVAEKGLASVNMRSVAEACHVALGSLYNYFSSKEELILAAIGSVWQDIFHTEPCWEGLSFPEYVRWIFERVQSGMRAYPNFFTAHSISFASTSKQQARSTMEQYVSHIKAELSQALRADSNVRRDAFSSDFQEPEFIEFVLTNLLTLLAQQKDTCEILLEVIRRSLYESRA